jgi:hypothetical protein
MVGEVESCNAELIKQRPMNSVAITMQNADAAHISVFFRVNPMLDIGRIADALPVSRESGLGI